MKDRTKEFVVNEKTNEPPKPARDVKDATRDAEVLNLTKRVREFHEEVMRAEAEWRNAHERLLQMQQKFSAAVDALGEYARTQ